LTPGCQNNYKLFPAENSVPFMKKKLTRHTLKD